MAARTKEDFIDGLNGKVRYLICFADEDGKLWYVRDIKSLDESIFTTEFEQAARFDEFDSMVCQTLCRFAYPERIFELMKITIAVEFC